MSEAEGAKVGTNGFVHYVRGRRYVPHADLQSTGNVSFEEVKNAYPRTKGEMAQVDSRAGGRFASFSALYR